MIMAVKTITETFDFLLPLAINKDLQSNCSVLLLDCGLNHLLLLLCDKN